MTPATDSTQSGTQGDVIRVALFSDDRDIRAQVVRALGRRVARDLPELAIDQFATAPALVRALEESTYDLGIFDAEAAPLGGMGVSMQIKDELPDPPPVVLLVARQEDAWLAAWSRAEAITPYPIDPIHLPNTVAEVLRADRAGKQTPLAGPPMKEPGASSRHQPEPSDDAEERELAEQ